MTFFNKSNNSFTLFYTRSTQVSNRQSPELISDYLCGKGDVPSQTITFDMYMLILDKYKLMQLFRFLCPLKHEGDYRKVQHAFKESFGS